MNDIVLFYLFGIDMENIIFQETRPSRAALKETDTLLTHPCRKYKPSNQVTTSWKWVISKCGKQSRSLAELLSCHKSESLISENVNTVSFVDQCDYK